MQEKVKEMSEYMRADLTYQEYNKTLLLAQIAINIFFKMANPKSARRCFERLLDKEYDKKEIEINLHRRYPLDLEKIKQEEDTCQVK